MRKLWPVLVLMLFALSGCALPPALMVASYVATGVSYIATGKSLSDHGISIAMGEDCALWRVVVDRDICVKEAEPPSMMADGTAESPKIAAISGPDTAPDTAPAAPTAAPRSAPHTIVAVALPPPAPQPASLQPAASQPSAPQPVASGDARRYFAIGSFTNHENADRLAGRFADVHATIVAVNVDGRDFRRVVVGPLTPPEESTIKDRLPLTEPYVVTWVRGGEPAPAASPGELPLAHAAPRPAPHPAGHPVIRLAHAERHRSPAPG